MPVLLGVIPEAAVHLVRLPRGAPVVLREEHLLEELVQAIKVDVREDRAGDPALRRTTEGLAVLPALKITGLEPVLDQPQEAVVMDLLAEDRQQGRMAQAVEAFRDVPLDEPGRGAPPTLDRRQGGVAPESGAEAV